MDSASVADMANMLLRLRNAVDDISVGLSEHFEFEEKYMPSVFGENVMNAVTFEHDEIRRKLIECQASFRSKVDAISQESAFEYRSTVESLVGNLVSMIEGHASREELILRMRERVFEKQTRGGG